MSASNTNLRCAITPPKITNSGPRSQSRRRPPREKAHCYTNRKCLVGMLGPAACSLWDTLRRQQACDQLSYAGPLAASAHRGSHPSLAIARSAAFNAWHARKAAQRAALEAKAHAETERFWEATRVSGPRGGAQRGCHAAFNSIACEACAAACGLILLPCPCPQRKAAEAAALIEAA